MKKIKTIAAIAATVASFGAYAQTTPTPVDTPPMQNDAVPPQQNDAGKLPSDQNVTPQQERTVTQPGMKTRAEVRAEVSNKKQPSHVVGETRTNAPDSTVNGSAGTVRTAKKDGQPEVR